MSKKVMLYVLTGILLCALLAMAVAGKSRFPLVNKAVVSIMLPLTEAITEAGNLSDGMRGYWRAMTVLQSENEKLKKDNEELRNANIQMVSIFAENRQLRELLNYKEQHKTQQLTAAKVIARKFGDVNDTMYIDAGKDKGIQREMAVVNNGLVGVVDEVYDSYARVLLLNSPRFKIGARVLRIDSNAVGVVGGKANSVDKLRLEHIMREANMREGDLVVTSGYSGTHPADILIGTVQAARMDSSGLLQEADVAPAVDVADIEHVMVITAFAPQSKIELTQGGQAQ